VLRRGLVTSTRFTGSYSNIHLVSVNIGSKWRPNERLIFISTCSYRIIIKGMLILRCCLRATVKYRRVLSAEGKGLILKFRKILSCLDSSHRVHRSNPETGSTYPTHVCTIARWNSTSCVRPFVA